MMRSLQPLPIRWLFITVGFMLLYIPLLMVNSSTSSSSPVRSSSSSDYNDIVRGWGEQYTWHTFNESLRRSQIEDKPIMLIYWKSWCNVCKVLQDHFARSEAIRQWSRKFILVNVGDEIEMDTPNQPVSTEDIYINVNGELNALSKKDNNFWNPSNRRFAPDGAYVPRVLFVNSQGNIMDDIFNLSLDRNEQYKYFYPSDTSIAVAMQRAAVAYNNYDKGKTTKGGNRGETTTPSGSDN